MEGLRKRLIPDPARIKKNLNTLKRLSIIGQWQRRDYIGMLTIVMVCVVFYAVWVWSYPMRWDAIVEEGTCETIRITGYNILCMDNVSLPGGVMND